MDNQGYNEERRLNKKKRQKEENKSPSPAVMEGKRRFDLCFCFVSVRLAARNKTCGVQFSGGAGAQRNPPGGFPSRSAQEKNTPRGKNKQNRGVGARRLGSCSAVQESIKKENQALKRSCRLRSSLDVERKLAARTPATPLGLLCSAPVEDRAAEPAARRRMAGTAQVVASLLRDGYAENAQICAWFLAAFNCQERFRFD